MIIILCILYWFFLYIEYSCKV